MALILPHGGAPGRPDGALWPSRYGAWHVRRLSGLFAWRILGDLGADVITVESVEAGDDTRRWGPPFEGEDAAYFHSACRGPNHQQEGHPCLVVTTSS